MKKINKIGALTILMTSLLISLFAGLTAKAEAVGYAIRSEVNEFQVDQSASYFDLALQPGQETTLVVLVINTSDEAGTFNVNATSARTSDGLAIEYEPSTKKDKSLAVDFAKIANVKTPQVTVPAKSEVKVSIDVKMPDEQLKGTLLGSIHVIKEVDPEVLEEGGFYNQFAYAKPVIIHENNVKEVGDLKLKSVKMISENFVHHVVGNIQNYRAGIIREVSAKTTITKKGSNKVILENELTGGTIAPNTNFNLKLNFGEDDLETGTYTYHTVIFDNAGHTWDFKKNFKFDKKELDTGGLSFGGSNNNQLLIIALMVLIVLFIIFIAILLLFLKKKKKGTEDNWELIINS